MTFLVTLFAFGLNAQDFSWVENAPDKYQPSTTKIIITRTSPCNQGEEAFMDFIPKFRTDKAFRDKRIKLSSDDEIGNSMVGAYDNWYLIKAGKGVNKREGYKYYATWFNISANQVCFSYADSPTDPNAEWGGSNACFRFQRIGGKWYLTGIMLAG